MIAQNWEALWLSIQLASLTTLILLIIGAPLAWKLSYSRWRYKSIIQSIITLPLVLPPTVIGFYLLIAFSPAGPIGAFIPLAFSFEGLVVASIIYSLPFVVQPIQNAFSAINSDLLDAASTLGASPCTRFFKVAIPLAKPGFITATVLGFAHTLGEFGIILMIGGNIPGETQVISIRIYEQVEGLQYQQAHILSALLLIFSFMALQLLYFTTRNKDATSPI